MSRQDRDDRRIVVGVDGSPSSMAALRWAVLQAELTGCTVEAVTAWRLPSRYGFAAVTDRARDFEGDARKILADALNEVNSVEPDVIIRSSVVEGHPAEVLVRAARRADMLVVGSRGHGGFTGALLGSVSQYCVHNAPCPVLVIRGTGWGGQ
ncbi:MAG: universal stress protein [Streptosporangiaceae bacterium]